MTHRLTIVLAFMLGTLLTGDSSAFYPVDGWWWNPEQSGRGFNIEMQDDEMFIAAFHYRDNGDPLWWVANGRYNHSTGIMTGTFVEFAGGQCPGCSYMGPPELVQDAGSAVTIEFHNAISATLSWNGESISLQRQYWRFAPDQPNLFLYGEFHFTTGALGVYFGDRIYLNESMTDNNGNEFIAGQRREGSSQRIAVARFDASTGMFGILIDSSTSYYTFFGFDMTKDRLEGDAWTYEKDSSLSGSGLPFIGHRVASRAYVQSGTGPHSIKQLSTEQQSFDRANQDRQMIELQHALDSNQTETNPANDGATNNRAEVAGLLHSLEQAHKLIRADGHGQHR